VVPERSEELLMRTHGIRHGGTAVAVRAARLVGTFGSAVAVAATRTGDDLITKRTLSGNRLRLDTVTGKEVAEGKLGTVPKARLATHLPKLVWHTLTLANGWQNYNGSVRLPAWAIDAQGVVHLRGAIYQPSPGDVTFAQLPVAARPQVTVYLATDMVNASPGRIDISSDGTMQADYYNVALDAQSFTNLDGVTYALR
jgi:hypothetical protein